MSDLIREVVEDILAQQSGVKREQANSDVSRPNYQRRRAEARLNQLGMVDRTDAPLDDRRTMASTVDFSELSADMRRACLTHECDRAPRILSREMDGTVAHGEVIGRLGGEAGIWWISGVDRRALTPRVAEVYDGSAAAIIQLAKVVPHQVLLIDEAIHHLGQAVTVRIGAVSQDGSRMLGLSHAEERVLKASLKALASGLGRAQYPHKEIYVLENPCGFVQRLLELPSKAETFGVLMDVSELDGVLIADWIYQNVGGSAITVDVRSGWLSITGPKEDVHKAIDIGKWHRDRLRG